MSRLTITVTLVLDDDVALDEDAITEGIEELFADTGSVVLIEYAGEEGDD